MEKLRRVIERARREGVRFVVFAGDTFDSNALPSSIPTEFFELLSRATDINFVILPGGGSLHSEEVSGHDAYTEDSLYRRLEVRSFFVTSDNLRLLTPEEPVAVFGSEAAFYGGFFDYPRVRKVSEVRYHIAVIHGAFGRRSEFDEKPLDHPSLSFYHYIALGHYHSFKRVSERAAYSGAFVQFEFLPYGDATSGYIEVDLSSDPPEITYIPFEDAPKFLYLKVLSERDLEKLRGLDFESSFVRITEYLEEFREDLEELKRRYPERVRINEGAEVKRDSLILLEILDEILKRRVPEHLREEVSEVLHYGLRLSLRRAEFERFLREKYGF